ncbi:RNA-guided endonuclease TnpB family protein [Clostridium sporogenes]|uniref:RNA-guided endonuclease TnpB family protein n=1 Tax=Clostridium sporogenes TaxID=1509 RepID=UPI00313E476D
MRYLYNLDNAYKNFFRKIKKGNKSKGFPKFKSKKNHYYSYTTNFTNNNIKVDFDNNKVQLPKLKWIKDKLQREFKGKILFATISKTPSSKYFVSFNVECEHQELKQNNNKIAMDLGIKDLLITSNGTKIDNKKLTYKYEQKLAKLQRQIAKKKIGSNNWRKQRIKIARLHEKITNIRKDNLHKISQQIVKENQLIFSENLNIKGMVKNHNLAKSIHDCGWYEFTRQLTYKSEWNNRMYHKVDRFYPSSQLCSNCGYKNEDTKNLGIRFWECPQCHTKHDRDENASINILNQGLKELKKVS